MGMGHSFIMLCQNNQTRTLLILCLNWERNEVSQWLVIRHVLSGSFLVGGGRG